MDVIGVQVVLHDVLVNPVDLRASDPVLAQPQQPVHVGVSADGSVIGIMLDVESCLKLKFFVVLLEEGSVILNLTLTYESSEKAHGDHEVNGVVAVVVTVDLQ